MFKENTVTNPIYSYMSLWSSHAYVVRSGCYLYYAIKSAKRGTRINGEHITHNNQGFRICLKRK